MHPDFLLDALTLNQIQEWEAYDRIDPIGEWRGDYRMAKLASLIENIVRQLYPKKGEKIELTAPLDYMPEWNADKKKEKEVVKQSDDEIKKQVFSIANIFGAVRGNRHPDDPPTKRRK